MTAKDHSTAALWGIHGGRTGADADGIFLKKNLVALGGDPRRDLPAVCPTAPSRNE